MASMRQLVSLTLLTIIMPLINPLFYAEGISHRAEPIPYPDYAGIASAVEDAIASDLYRRSLAESSAAYAHIAARTSSSPRTPKCKTISKRKEWRQLTRAQKKDYMRAIKCLQTKGDYGISPASNTLFDAFVQVHQTNWIDFHGSAYFMPWHRWFVWLHDQSLRNECNYAGPTPFWNYTQDYRNPFGSPIFSTDPEVGFGTHGTTVLKDIGLGGFKVDNGAFANFKLNLPVPHYLTRNFSAWKDVDPGGTWGYALGESFSPKQVSIAMEQKTFYDLEVVVDGLNNANFVGIHNGPHLMSMGGWNGLGWFSGTEYFPAAVVAPNDGIFWYVDQVFWMWQQQPGKQWLFDGSKGFNRTGTALPTDVMHFYDLGPDIPVALSLKTESWPLCYTY